MLIIISLIIISLIIIREKTQPWGQRVPKVRGRWQKNILLHHNSGFPGVKRPLINIKWKNFWAHQDPCQPCCLRNALKGLYDMWCLISKTVKNESPDETKVRVVGKLNNKNNLIPSTQDLRLGWRFTVQQDKDSNPPAKTTQDRFKDKPP